MPYADSKYVRKSERGKLKTDDMNEAIKMRQSRDLLLREASEQFRLPKSTLARRVTEKKKIATGGNKTSWPPSTKTFEGILKNNL